MFLGLVLWSSSSVTPTWVTGIEHCPIAEGHDENVSQSNMASPRVTRPYAPPRLYTRNKLSIDIHVIGMTVLCLTHVGTIFPV